MQAENQCGGVNSAKVHDRCPDLEFLPIYKTMPTSPLQSAPSVILVVDDSEFNRELLQKTLVGQGFAVITAQDGASAAQVLGETKVDLILLDVLMPQKDGFDVCLEIKNNPETCFIPVVFITTLSDQESRLKGILAGADDLLTRPIDWIELLARVRSLLRLKQRTDELERAEAVILSLAHTIECRDPNTNGHCERISSLARGLGEYIGLSEDHLNALRIAGAVHDIGKIAVPDAILLKAGPLSETEWRVMRLHPLVGERICAPLRSFRYVLPIIRHHHEKQDGSGYPDNLRGDQIPVAARVLQIADVYDALTSVRPYKCAMTSADALRMMNQEVQKGWWDPTIFQSFQDFIEESVTEIEPPAAVECSG
jgi:putative two-component system response regulator